MKIQTWLNDNQKILLKAGIKSACLDTELILAKTLGKPRTYLLAHGDMTISTPQLQMANALIKRRKKEEPIAYLFSEKEFYGRNFYVNKSVLIPRPESEDIINSLFELKKMFAKNAKVIDVGTGSGILAITTKLEFPDMDVTASDVSDSVLQIAQKNASTFKANITFKQQFLLNDGTNLYDIIIANLPYVDKSWTDTSKSIEFEPPEALFAKNGGLDLIFGLIKQTDTSLRSGGLLLLESDPTQFTRIKKVAKVNNLSLLKEKGYCISFIKN